ncbi:hypothetical protein ACFLT4_01030 [Chloroflexota bacterium]
MEKHGKGEGGNNEEDHNEGESCQGCDSYVCGVCGLAITVDEACGCVDFCDIICCG